MRWYNVIVLTVLVYLFGISIQNLEAAGAKKGDKVTLEYTGMLDDGAIFDASSNHDKPLQFEVGGGRVIPGFDKAVTGMKLGEEKKFTIPPAKAYGKPNPKLIKKVSRKEIPLKDLNYWNVELQEPYYSPLEVNERYKILRNKK